MQVLINEGEGVLAKAKGERDEILSQINELRARLARVETFIALYDEFAGKRPGDATSAHLAPKETHTTNSGPRKVPSIGDIAEQIIRANGPMPTSRLLRAINSHGRKVGGASPMANLASILSRDSRFTNSRETGWSVVGVPDSAAAELGI